ncbi:heparin lyase I family protein [Pedobacter arcticus]|uniref:heparin lyase I family protein n=1 Tax=Pedobacter arcticus TaxID=752140 RepID=UPI000474B09C|nr:heparin lyase I family protein [Pedobacter arcticus]
MKTTIPVLVMLLISSLSCSKKTSKEDYVSPIVKVENPIVPVEPEKTSGVTLSADGLTNTYTLINKYFGGTGDVIETPDCAHSPGAPHITQIYDELLKKYVFAFQIHVSPDNDRCLPATDRQRNEIKTYDKSPDSLLASLNETVRYSWKFKLDKDFKPSPNFTHIHQIKALDGDDDLPLITFTARYKSSGNKLEVIHTGGTGTTSLKYIASVPLSDFMGEWVEVKEEVSFSFDGKYQVLIKRISDGKTLLDLTVNNIDLWRDATTLCRPKWGIYRSLLSPEYIRDEQIRFNDFNITEIK